MKNYASYLLIVFFAFVCVNFAKSTNPASFAGIIEQVAASLNAHDAASLAASFDNSLEVTILDKESNYSRAQAEVVVRDFFNKVNPSSFKLNHQGNSPDGSMYGTGILNCSLGAIRVYYYTKQKGGRYFIQELRFEK